MKKHSTRRCALAGLLAALPLLALPQLAQAQAGYPDHPIRLIVPYAPGGSADIAARLVSDAWATALKQSLVIENRAGAGGNIGVDVVAKAPPDGYTIGLQTVSLAINPAIFATMPFDTQKDLAPIGMVATSQHVLVVNPKLPVKTAQELIALAKSEPGKLNYGSAGPGSTFHMAAELFKSMAGVDITHVPYRGGGPALVDTMSGQVQMSFPVLSAAQQQVQGGRLRALGVTGLKRSPMLPDVPTLAEAALPQYDFETWFMVFAPGGTPPAVIDKLNAALNEALKSDKLAQRMVQEGFDPLPTTPAQARDRLKKEMPVWAKLVKERGITVE
jgi:tripartite-type tricarboxylate transporter receptor subunit TctC